MTKKWITRYKFHNECLRKRIVDFLLCSTLCILCFVDCGPVTRISFQGNLRLINLKTIDPTLYYGTVRSKRHLSSPLSVLSLEECLLKSSCRDAKNITSHTQGNKNGVFFVATLTNIMKVTITNGPKKTCTCALIHNSTNPVLSIATDDSNVYWLTSNRSKLMYFPIRTQVSSPLVLSLSQEMHAEYIPHRNTACRILAYVPDIPNPKLISGSYMDFDISKIHQKQNSWFASKICVHEDNPNLSYAFLYMKLSGSKKKYNIQQSCRKTFDCMYLHVNGTSSLENIRLKNLTSNSEYLVHLIVFSESFNFKSAVVSPGKYLRTTCEVPGAVQNLHCTGINEKEIRLSWDKASNVNSEGVRYEVYRNLNNTPLHISNHNTHQAVIFASPPGIKNSFLVKSFAINCSVLASQYSSATIPSCQSFQPPPPLQVIEVTGMQATVKWNAPADRSVLYVIIQWVMRNTHATHHTSWSKSEKLNGSDSFVYKVTDLVPNSGYDFRAYQQYIGYTGGDGWQYSEITTAMTAAGVPSFPPSVSVKRESDGNFFHWETPNNNGKDLESYVIEYRNRSSPNATRVVHGTWKTARSISASFNRWQLEKLNENVWYEFRVSAVNAVGHGDASQPSDPFYYHNMEITEDDHTMWIVVGTTAGMVLFLFIIILCVACRCCSKESNVVQSPPSSEITTIHLSYGTDLQLAEIRHINDLANFKGIPNIPQDYMDLLPIFPRNKLTLTDFLGRGAFGEVFKGIARDVDVNLGTANVAVKTLREGATDSEKCEFLMEAYFMSNFNHENILSLIGVCLDNEPQYLILELMEGGDLLHYVREARPNPIMGPKLNTASLLDICIDVAAGCKYLEEQRFVHRDLAARNCLVSTHSYNSNHRVVKIGDFGLARDIYRNDYYHKAGEGLLPVRWMAPESLVDNIYTTQSDVWSFGVLVWEIITFGQQPYPARSNFEVLQLVRSGGRLDKPENCPGDIHALMMKCWHKTPSLRPTFGWALQWLQDFKDRNSHNLFGNESTTDECILNYTTVTTSEEDIVDNDSIASADLRAIEQFKKSLLEFNDDTCFEQELYNENSCPAGESAFIYEENAQNSIRIADDSSSHNAHQNGRFEKNSHATTTEANAVEKHFSQALPSAPLHLGIESPFLPYKGDLPITDEERIIRKQYWKCQLKKNAGVCIDNSEKSGAKGKSYEYHQSDSSRSQCFSFDNFPINTSNKNIDIENIAVKTLSNQFNFESGSLFELPRSEQVLKSNMDSRRSSSSESHEFSEYAQIGNAGDKFLNIVPMKKGHEVESDPKNRLSSCNFVKQFQLSRSHLSKKEVTSSARKTAHNFDKAPGISSTEEKEISTYV